MENKYLGLVSDVLWLFIGDVEIYDLADDDEENPEKLLGRYDLEDSIYNSYQQAINEYGNWIVAYIYSQDSVTKIIVVEPNEEVWKHFFFLYGWFFNSFVI